MQGCTRNLAGGILPWALFAAIGALIGSGAGCTPEKPEAKPQRKPPEIGSFFKPLIDPEPPKPKNVWPPRAIWVVRQAYQSPQQIASLMEQCRQAGLNTVLFQVRGEGTAFYRSSYEPWAMEYQGRDPGFDPLAVACREAHRRGLALHAWVNVMPAWRGERPPADPRQLYNARPGWFWYDQSGRRQPLGWYVSLNPCLPEVRQYLVSIMAEIATKYPVDGIHLDYIRFPNDRAPKGSDYPHDARTVSLYQAATGKRPQADRAAWTSWRTQQVTQLVREIRGMLRSRAADVKLTAACVPDMDEARRHRFQDAPTWAREGLIDAAFVMNYTADGRVFRRRQEAWRATVGRIAAVGIGVYLHRTPQTTVDQLLLAEQWGGGFALFSNNVLLTPTATAGSYMGAIRPHLLRMHQRAQSMGRAEGGRAFDSLDPVSTDLFEPASDIGEALALRQDEACERGSERDESEAVLAVFSPSPE